MSRQDDRDRGTRFARGYPKKVWSQTVKEVKERYPIYKIESLCGLFGHSRQAYYQLERSLCRQHLQEDVILSLVREAREEFPCMGCRKLLVYLRKRFQKAGIEIGRDAFIDLLGRNRMLVKRRRAGRKTTFSSHWLRKYPNLIRDYTPLAPDQLWVSDITYVETKSGFMYLSLVTDAYSRKIVGWKLAPTLDSRYSIDAIDMALKTLTGKHATLIHHSDRGVQYCSSDYVKKLTENNVSISMTESGDPLENAIAERMNGILKTEWINKMPLMEKQQALVFINKIISLYNQQRPHMSIGWETPESVHEKKTKVERAWKNYYFNKDKSKTMAIFDPRNCRRRQNIAGQ